MSILCCVQYYDINNKLVHFIDLALESLFANDNLGSKLCIKYWRIVPFLKDFVYHNSRWCTFNGRCQFVSKLLDVFVIPDSFKIKVIPSVAEYIFVLRERMYELIF